MFILSHKKYGEWEDFEVSSESSPDTSYLVTIDHDENTCYCTCPDFQYRKDNLKFGGAKINDNENHCKHILFALKIMEVINDGGRYDNC